ncbi:MAG: fructosamine kinase family protein [Microthrixaceae bacterium]
MGVGTALADRVGEALDGLVVAATRLGGGDVAEAYRVDLEDGRVVFAKTHRDPPPLFFPTEAASLRWLGGSGAVRVPKVLAVDEAMLALEWIAEGPPRRDTDANFGAQLAALHLAGAPSFGRADRATTTSRSLPNQPCETWAEFFAACRLVPLAGLGADSGALDGATAARIEALAGRLGRMGVPREPPARLHGDLWAGNRLMDGDGNSWLIDPASHGGHREFDLAMMALFGGFGPACWAAYEEASPLADGWQDRVPLHQLAPLITHAIKFGGGYVAAVDRALEAAERLG